MELPPISKLLSSWVIAALSALPVLIFIIAVVVGRRRDSRRQAALARVAAELGMGFTPEDHALLNQFGGYAFFPHGDWKRATSVMRGTVRGLPVALFDYHVTTGSSNNRNTSRLTVAAFDLAPKPLPVFEAQGGRDWVTRLLDKTLAPDNVIDFPDDPDFTRSFCVTGDDAQAVRRLLGPGARSFLKQRAGWTFRSNGRWLLMCRLRQRPKPGDYRAFVEEASAAVLAMTGPRA
ncbi:MAG TPA: hypothetical protein VIP46_18920 [Pyrinomonadaceae bacterium]